jgi:hypothetical protein
MNKTPTKCPSCEGGVIVTELRCKKCATTIRGEFFLSAISSLDEADEFFLKVFLKARGNIKEVEKQLGISYPTVRNKLEQLINTLGLGPPLQEVTQSRLDILKKLEKGEIKPDEALKLLKEI